MNFNPQNDQADETGIELTPLIDVVFLLLIFFMISTTFTKETSLKINLPAADQTPQKHNQVQRLEVHVGKDAQYAIASDDDGKARALVNSNRDTLYRALKDFAGNENLLLVIRADRQATHESVIQVLDIAQGLDMTNVTFATKQVIE